MTQKTCLKTNLTLVYDGSTASTVLERRSVTTSSQFVSTLNRKFGNKLSFKSSGNGVGGVKDKSSCETLGMCQTDGRCTDCKMKG